MWRRHCRLCVTVAGAQVFICRVQEAEPPSVALSHAGVSCRDVGHEHASTVCHACHRSAHFTCWRRTVASRPGDGEVLWAVAKQSGVGQAVGTGLRAVRPAAPTSQVTSWASLGTAPVFLCASVSS